MDVPVQLDINYKEVKLYSLNCPELPEKDDLCRLISSIINDRPRLERRLELQDCVSQGLRDRSLFIAWGGGERSIFVATS